MAKDFVFVGYLIQEPYWTAWPGRGGYKVASIEREFHPVYNKFQWNKVDGIENPTRFLTVLPDLSALSLEPHNCKSKLHRESAGWTVSGYSFPHEFVEQRTITSRNSKTTLQEFAYALKLERESNGLRLLGYEVVDEDDFFLSILNNCGYSVAQVKNMAGPLNEYSLLSSAEDAKRFTDAIKIDPRNPKIVPDHNRGVIVEVWGKP